MIHLVTENNSASTDLILGLYNYDIPQKDKIVLTSAS